MQRMGGIYLLSLGLETYTIIGSFSICFYLSSFDRGALTEHKFNNGGYGRIHTWLGFYSHDGKV